MEGEGGGIDDDGEVEMETTVLKKVIAIRCCWSSHRWLDDESCIFFKKT